MNEMRPAIVNGSLIVAYAIGGLSVITLDLAAPLAARENLWRLVAVVAMFGIVLMLMRTKRPDTGQSVLKRGGLWLPFYLP